MERMRIEKALKRCKLAVKMLSVILLLLVTDRVCEYRTKLIVAEANAEVIPIYCTSNEVVYGAELTEPIDLTDFEYKKNMELFVPVSCDMNDDLQEYVWMMCQANNLDFTLVMALMKHESGYNASVISSTNDYGLMQINKINHEYLSKVLGITDYLDAEQNIKAGVYILKSLFEKYDNTRKVLMAYNMGESGAREYWNNGIYETAYCEKVLLYQAEFKQQLGW